MKPTVGRIVHYHPVVAYGPDATPEEMAKPLPLLTCAAIVADIHEVDGVEYPVLRILMPHPSEDFMVDCAPGNKHDGVHFAEAPTMGCWNWPPRA